MHLLTQLSRWLCLAALITCSTANAIDWQASWIWNQQKFTDANTWVAFRKDVELNKTSKTATAYISADTKYWLWINGELVVFEGSYTGGPTPVVAGPRIDEYAIAANKYYDEVDISPYLKKGNNTIAALAWYYGDNGKKGTHISSNKGGFIFQAQVGDTTIISDKSWKAKQHEAYQPFFKEAPSRIAAWGIQYDARQDLGDWSEQAWYLPSYNDSDWQAAKQMRQPARAPFYGLYPSEIPPLNNYGLANCENYPDAAFPFVSEGKTINCVVDFNKNLTPYFDIEADAGLTIKVDSNFSRNTIKTSYTTKAGRQQFESLSWMNARTIKYSIPKGVTVHGLKYRWTGVGSTPGHFEADDEWYSRIWQMAENTLYICARDNFMDTPDRERGLWIGDVADQASYLFYSMDKPGRDLLKKAIKVTMAFSDSETGIFAGLGPGRFRELPAQSLQFIDQAIWHYYVNTGDLETLAYAYPYVHRYLELWGTQESGLATFRTGAWAWTDWGPQDTIDYPVIQNALYYSALVAARNMAKELGDDTHMSFYNARIIALKHAFNTEFWQDGYYSSQPDKLKDDRANAVAILFGLADKNRYQQIVDNVLIPNQFASPHFEWMVYNAMAIAGRHEDALARMKQRYNAQVSNPERSTLTEYMTGKGTENHAWNAPSTVLSQHIAGIAPTATAWKTYEIMPNMLHMKRIQQIVPSVQGDIEFTIQRDDNSVSIDLTSPQGTIATVGIPKAHIDIASVKLGRKVIWEDGKAKQIVKGLRFVGEDESYIKFEVAGGSWALNAKSN